MTTNTQQGMTRINIKKHDHLINSQLKLIARSPNGRKILEYNRQYNLSAVAIDQFHPKKEII